MKKRLNRMLSTTDMQHGDDDDAHNRFCDEP